MSSPYMPLFVADYLADTAHLSASEHGAYLMLIMNYWQRGKALADDDRKLARVARMSDAEWQDARETLAEFFDVADGEWRPRCAWAHVRKGSEHRTTPAGWQETRLRIFARDGFACSYCGSGNDLQCDHIVPVSRGGGHDDANLTTACRGCNTRKGSKLLSEWRA